MLKWDEVYDTLCRKIMSKGVEVENRTTTNSIKIPSFNFTLDVSKEFPILTTKKLYSRQAILEIMWIYLIQSNDVRWLQERNVHIWDEWEIDDEGYWISEQKIKQPDGSFKIEQVKKFFGKEYSHTIGTAYGYLVKKYKKTQKALDLLINHPESRRNVTSLWQDDYLETGVLEPCVWSHELDVTNGKLNMYVHQRSCDVPLGLPFNVTQYAALMHMYARSANLEVGELSWSIKDAHIYVDQLEGIKEQIKRVDLIRQYENESQEYLISKLNILKSKLESQNNDLKENELEDIKRIINVIEYVMNENVPVLWLNPEINDFFAFDTSKDCKDIKVLKYKDLGPIKFPISQ